MDDHFRDTASCAVIVTDRDGSIQPRVQPSPIALSVRTGGLLDDLFFGYVNASQWVQLAGFVALTAYLPNRNGELSQRCHRYSCRLPLVVALCECILSATGRTFMVFGKSTSSNADEGAFAPFVFTIPDRLRPSWSQLPALARLVTDRLGNTLVRWPVLGPAFRSAAVCLNWCTLAAGHSAGWVTACGTDAVLWLRPVHPPGTPLRTRLREHLVRSAALAPALLASAALIMSVVAGATPAGGVLLLLGLMLGAWWALGALAILRSGTSTKATGRHERSLIRKPGIRLVVACGLAASAVPQTPHAATRMLLALRRTADERHLTLLASAATEQLAAQYQRHGFARLRTGDRHLLRAPQPIRSAASSTPTEMPPDGR